jgi:phospholipase/lecithinase/hemolysin
VNSSSRVFATAILVLIAAPSGARAGTIDAIYAFGDSLSDVGNVFALTGIPVAPYASGQFSNGPVWVQGLAAGLGLAPLTPSVLGGTDYAYGSGETGNASFDTSNPVTNILGPTGQLAQYEATHATADPNALYTIWIGSNDLTDIPAGSTPTQVAADIAIIAANIDTTIGTLAGLGAKNFLIVTVPDLGKSPAAIATGPLGVATATALSGSLDSTLVNGAGPIPSLGNLAALDGLNLKVLDTFSLVDAIVANPSAFHLTDVTDPCLTGGTTVCANPNQFLFWDQLHPTAAVHAIVAADAFTLVTPEPSSVWLTGAGFLGLCLLARRYAHRDRIRYSRQPDRICGGAGGFARDFPGLNSPWRRSG